MRCGRHIAIVLLIAAAASLAVAGCGGSSSAETSSKSGNVNEFKSSGGKSNKFTSFGQEASAEEREAASQVLEQNLRARAAGDWATQCSTLAAVAIGELEKLATRFSPSAKKGCPNALKAQAEPLARSKTIRAYTMTGPIDVLMVKGERGYALYHGTGGKDYAMPMEKANGQWKVGSLITTEVP